MVSGDGSKCKKGKEMYVKFVVVAAEAVEEKVPVDLQKSEMH